MRTTKLPANILRLTAVATLLFLTGCRGAPSVNILGSFFPGWMVCALLGVIGTYILKQIFVMTNIEAGFSPRPLVYAALWVLITLLSWLLFFRS
jgi:hypothetical protein